MSQEVRTKTKERERNHPANIAIELLRPPKNYQAKRDGKRQ